MLEEDANVGFNVEIFSAARVRVGARTLIAAYTYLVGGDHLFDRVDIPVLHQGRTARGIDVGENVWLGAHVVVADGVPIGRDAIVGAGAVVTRDVAEFQVAAGVPARVVRDRPARRRRADRMCGIVGIVERDLEPPVPPGEVERMVRTLNHRGPDEEGSCGCRASRWRCGGRSRFAAIPTIPHIPFSPPSPRRRADTRSDRRHARRSPPTSPVTTAPAPTIASRPIARRPPRRRERQTSNVDAFRGPALMQHRNVPTRSKRWIRRRPDTCRPRCRVPAPPTRTDAAEKISTLNPTFASSSSVMSPFLQLDRVSPEKHAVAKADTAVRRALRVETAVVIDHHVVGRRSCAGAAARRSCRSPRWNRRVRGSSDRAWRGGTARARHPAAKQHDGFHSARAATSRRGRRSA